ncbi:MAG: DMT family transporter [Bryobacteraceae bacterium]
MIGPRTGSAPAKSIPSAPARSGAIRLYSLLLLFLAFRAFGNLALAWGTKHLGEGLALNPLAYFRALLNPAIAVGILLLIAGIFARLALLSLADLSFVVPMTAVGYVIAAVFGKFFLNEQVSWKRWLGLALVFAGVAIVGSTSANTTQVESSEPPEDAAQ